MVITHAMVVALVLFASADLGSCVRTIKSYTVNLDLPEEQRWHQVAADNKNTVADIHTIILTYIPKMLMPLIEIIAAGINNYIPAPYAKEMTGIAQTLNCSVGDVVAANLIYDVSAFCTSIVSQDTSGQIWHSRNLDYAFVDMLKNITIAVDFKQAGQTVYSAITYAGYIGVLSGQRSRAFSITVDQREKGNILENLLMALLYKDVVPVSFLVRNSMAEDPNFSASISRLSRTHTAAPVYFIVAGTRPGEGAVVTKSRVQADDVWYLNQTDRRWFLVETNYDHWTTPPPTDDRRGAAIQAMEKMGRDNITVDNLFKVMSTPPVLNKRTIYTVVMSPATPGVMRTWVRN